MVATRGLVVGTLGLCFAAFAVANAPGSSSANGAPADAKCAPGAGQQVYDRHCASCHGSTLAGGRGPALTGVSFWGRWSTDSVAKLTSKIRMTMPADDPGSLEPSQVTELVNYILTVNGHSELCAVSKTNKSP